MSNRFSRRDLAAAIPGLIGAALPFQLRAQRIESLKVSENQPVKVGVMISDNAVVMDFCGPIAVFESTNIPSRKVNAFELYTIAENANPVKATGGLSINPTYTFANAPQPNVILIPEQKGGEAMVDWIRTHSKNADLTMSVCTGAFILVQTGLLNGKSATTHHGSYGRFGMNAKQTRLKRGYRFVDEGNVATSGGLSSGMDLALHVVERYYGRQAAENTANWLEYQGEGWKDVTGASNQAYAKRDPNKLECPICTMPLDTNASNKFDYKGKTYYFCTASCKGRFEADPEGALQALNS